MQVVKRDGRIVEFNPDKITHAVMKAGGDLDLGEQIAVEIKIRARDYVAPNDLTVELIQDWVEDCLMGFNHHAIAKHYILYRAERTRLRNLSKPPDDEMISDYTFYAKYSRNGESWTEAVTRLMDMHIRRFPDLQEEIIKHFQLVYDKKVLPSMRSLQFGGEAIEVNNARMYNCAFSLADRPRFFSELFYLLLSGCGVGYSVQRKHVAELPIVCRVSRARVLNCRVGDSIKGWAEALDVLIESYLNPDAKHAGAYVEFMYDQIRPMGSELRISGGRAPGHVPLKNMLELIRMKLDSCAGRNLRPIEVSDICCVIAEAVLAGGIRRSSLMCLFSVEDQEMMDSKTGDWMHTAPWRAMANNSAVFLREHDQPDQFLTMFKQMKQFGEPGFLFVSDYDYGTNPCGEIGLHPKIAGVTGFAFCNLTEINAVSVTSRQDFLEAVRAATFIGTLQASYTDFPYLTPVSSSICQAQALLGVSITGLSDNPLVLKHELLSEGSALAVESNKEFAEMIGINAAERVTTIKPSGTASLLLGCSSGIHPHHARKYFRRITANPNEPVFRKFFEVNPHMCEQKPNGDYAITFPVQVPDDAIVKGDLTSRQFMDMIYNVYDAWVRPGSKTVDLTHNVSCTVSVREEEWDDVAADAWAFRYSITAMSFLPDIGDKIYPYAPREEVVTAADHAKWNELIEKYRPVQYGVANDELAPACEGPVCEMK
jgi:ribonucleoside-triphosphate reductase